MKKTYTCLLTAFILAIAGMVESNAQVEFRLLDLPLVGNSSLHDVNNDGLALNPGSYYDFQTDAFIPLEMDAVGLGYMNNNGDVSGDVFYDEPNFVLQPGYKLNGGTWQPVGWFPASDPYSDFYTTYGISPSGQYVTGQMSTGSGAEFGSFLFDTVNQTLSEFWDPNGEALTAYDVNDQGVMVGWVDVPNGGGTNRTPAYFSSSLGVNIIAVPQINGLSTANNINGNNIIVGHIDEQPFIYDLNNDVLEVLDVPTGYLYAEFLDISENGIAIGHATNPSGARDAIIYHPTLGAEPILLRDVLLDFGINVNTFDGLLGTGFAISEDGNFMVGRDNQFFFFAQGWIVDFDDLLLVQSACTIVCPDDIEVTAADGNYTEVVEYEITFDCGSNPPPAGTEVVQVQGLPSGAEFPIGTTFLFFELVDANGDVLDSCGMFVTVNDFYCNTDYTIAVEPITYVEFAGIENTTSPDPNSPVNEFFFDLVAEVEQGGSYPIAVEGYTGGPFVDYITAFIDWNQDYEFNSNDEMYAIGTIENSSGTDGIQAVNTIAVPADAPLGITRMRVVKNWDFSQTDPCGSFSYGQTEDYLVNVSESNLGISDAASQTIGMFPNPAKDSVTLVSTEVVNQVRVYDITGKLVVSTAPAATSSTLNIAALTTGVYFINVSTNNTVHTLKLIKE